MKKLFLLDAYALIFRAYYALIKMPRITSSGFNTSAIFGFVNTLEELLRKENPTHLAVCFDPSGPTFRHEAFADYKGEREATPEDIKLAIPIIKEIVQAYNIPLLEVAGFEADDVIGTMATRAAAQGFKAYMMTPDKDFGQLVTEDILQYKPAYRGGEFELRGPKEVCEKYGIETPRQVIDLLALMGDKVDNIPGCPGVGEKTAVKLINEFGSVDKLIASTSALKGALKKKVEENTEQIVFSKYLATIRTDVPLDVEPDSLLRTEPDTAKLIEIFSRLEFRTLIERVKRRLNEKNTEKSVDKRAEKRTEPLQRSLFDLDEEEAEETAAVVAKVEAPEIKVEMLEAEVLASFRQKVKEAGSVALYTIAEGEADMTAVTRGWAFSLPGEPATGYLLKADTAGGAELVKELYEAQEVAVISHQVKRDYVCLHNLLGGAAMELCNYFDVTVAHYILQPDMRHSLPLISSMILGIELPDIEAGKKKKQASLPASELYAAAASYAHAIGELRAPLEKEIVSKGMERLLREIELPLIPVLADMEIAGVGIDVAALNEAARDMGGKIDSLEREIHELAGETFNVGSPAKVGEILFDKMKLSAKPKKTKTGQYSTSEEELEKISHLSPIVGKILEYRQLKKLLSTYLTALPDTINSLTGKIHTTYNQTVTATGRLSSSDPNLQNIPIREAVGREIRRAFIPSPGNLFLSADYSQIELRLVADFAEDAHMLEAFATGADIHAATAAKIFHIPAGEVTAEERRKAKTANFGILYGISAFGLSQRLGIPRGEAKELIDSYFASFPTIREYIDSSVEQAREKGYVTTIEGRRRLLPDINSRNATVRGYAERNAVNAPIQGSAADIIKIAMVRIAARMKQAGLQSKMIMQVHDELNFDVLPSELDALRQIVKEEMEGAYNGRVHLTASIGVGPDWLSAH